MNTPKKHYGLLSMFLFVVLAALFVNTGITIVFLYLFQRNGLVLLSGITPADLGRLALLYAVLSIPVGFFVSLMATKFPLKPIRNLIDSMDKLASGDFQTRINVGNIMRRYPAFVGLADSFNKMAEELESKEMLRNDFVNNFSHEFKTPIVSISGFAKLLRRGNLTQQQQQEYLSIIEEEAMRLSYMATNVLNLTKVENQSILTEVHQYNLSEQIRSCILLLENKWVKKDLDLQLDFDEYKILADEELMKQVWINLLDNAIKFAPNGHTVKVRIEENKTELRVSIFNTGSKIPPDKQAKIFGKFYQADESHSTEGNGVGLAIVKRITELHGGAVSGNSTDEGTIFTVKLPKRVY